MSKHLKILVIDDDEAIRDLFARILNSGDCQVTIVADGPKAILAVDQQHYDLAFIDMQMPGLDGLQTFRELKQRQPDINVVIMTAAADADRLAAAKAEGVIDCLEKPFDLEQVKVLLSIISEN